MFKTFLANLAKHPAGAIGSLFQLAVVFVGMPAQILANYQAHSTEGLSPWMFIFGGLASVAWAIHAAFEVKSLPILIPQIPSIIFTAVIVGQMVCY